MKVTELCFKAEERSLCGRMFMPEGNPVALLQIVHDIGEDLSAYHALAEHLTACGVIVFGCDLRGHGNEGKEQDFCHFGKEKGLEGLLSDQKAVFDFVRKKYRYLPMVLLGHGVGSIVARMFMARFHLCLDGVALSGIYEPRPSYLVSKLLCLLNSSKTNGAPALGKKLFGCEVPLTASSYSQILSAHQRVTFAEFAQALEMGVPVAIFEGEEEPLGKGAKSALDLHEQFSLAEFCTLSLKLYEKVGHHLHSSSEKELYFADLEAFVLQVAEGVREARTAGVYY